MNDQYGKCYKAHEMIEDRLHCTCGCEKVITGEWDNYDYCPKCGAKVEVYDTPWGRKSEEEERRKLCRENYARQLNMLGYEVDGNPKK